jgi:iron complex outermembrane receptor protein
MLLANSGLVSVCCQPAWAQDALSLPEIRVTAPSPIVRRATTAGPPAQTTAPVPIEAPLLGALPIVADQFATVTVVPREELQRSPGSTLGDVLFSKPGITGSSFAPGASSRPIVRGLDVNRVGIVSNGVGGGGVSDLGEDHFVPIDPLVTNQVEVIRGPATLRYGSQAIGGVVSATDNRIPEALPCSMGPLAASPLAVKTYPQAAPSPGCIGVETRAAVSSVDNGREGAVLLDAGAGNIAMHGDVFGRRTSDYRVPSYPYLVAPDPAELPSATQSAAFNGRQPNSWSRSSGGAVGGSYLFTGGFAGLAVMQNNSLYGIPGPDGEGHNTRIDARQTKVLGKGEYRPQSSAVDAIRYWLGHTDYKHDERGLADAFDQASDGVRQTFTNKEQEARLEVQFAPFNLNLAALTTAVGVQAGHQELTASSPDDPGSPLNGLYDPNKNTRIAGYIFNEFRFNEMTKAQLAGRIEHVSLSGTMPASIPNTFDLALDPAAVGAAAARDLNFTPKSGSLGLIQNLPFGGLVASATAQYVERAPKPAELFSRGAHDATATFDIGNPTLTIESAKSVEIGLRRPAGHFRFEATAYYTRFSGFIYRNLTGNSCEEQACVDPADAAFPLELNQARYDQRDAIFRGAEVQFQWDLVPMNGGFFGVDGQYDIVRATFTDGSNVPRIPPQRLGGGVYFRSAEWLARLNLLHAFAQNDIAVTGETPTAGYNLLKAELSRTTRFRHHPTGIKQVTVGVVGNNLLNENIRNHVSYTKDVVLMPGLNVRAFASVKY